MAEAPSAVVATSGADTNRADTDVTGADMTGTDTTNGGAMVFRTIGDLAVRCGIYCWLEHRLFALTGRAASASTPSASTAVDAEIRVFLSATSARHAFLAAQWRDRLPVRAGVDADALVVPPPGDVGAALDLLGTAPGPLFVLGGLLGQILPRLLIAYDDDAAHASAISEAPVRAVLGMADLLLREELRDGRSLLDRGSEGAAASRKMAEFENLVQRALGSGIGISPAARAS
jgi:hypothetical protein